MAVSLKVLKADYHGCYLTVSKSKCPSYVGTTGIVLMETKNIFKIITKDDKFKCMYLKHHHASHSPFLQWGYLCISSAIIFQSLSLSVTLLTSHQLAYSHLLQCYFSLRIICLAHCLMTLPVLVFWKVHPVQSIKCGFRKGVQL